MTETAARTLAEHVGLAAAVLDADGHIAYANPAFEEHFPATAGADVRTVFGDAVGQTAGVDRVGDAVEQVVDDGVDQADAELTVTGDAPSVYHLQVTAVDAADAAAIIEACNVTERLENTPRVGTILGRISESFYAVDDEWRVTYWNEQMASRTGVPAADIVGQSVWDVFDTDAITELRARYEAAMDAGESTTFTTYLPDPLDYWVEVRLYPDEHGMSVFSRDVTTDVERERELERYETIVENANDAVMIKDCEGRYRLANDAVADYTGRDTEAVFGKTDQELFGPEVGDRVRERERIALEEERRVTYEERIPTDDGEVVFETTRIPFYEGGELAGTIGICRDVTDQVAYEARLEARSEQLELLNRILRHDIRNDMTVVLAVLDLLSEHVADDEGADLVEEVGERAQHVVDLTATLRDLMTVVLDETEHLQPVPVAGVLEDELADVDAAFPRAITRIDGDLPDVAVRANEMLHSVFRNLLKNAVQHNDQDLPEVVVSATATDDTVTVRVADNGPGIPDDRKTKVFGRDEKGLESSGTGVGLFLVDRLVDEFDGSVHVEDNDPSGAIFVVELPRWTADLAFDPM
ncbi:PAS domain-containing protein [Halorubellus salinus]|uniref:PAS domain-containing protein n=1 Tax=Halorubellus salinus TaxID=755309 RepID=UPI001D09397D|nr:PAS domain-containing protein [Halorubellus salinus]